MTIFEVQGPDGTIYEVQADSMEQAAAAVKAQMKGSATGQGNTTPEQAAAVKRARLSQLQARQEALALELAKQAKDSQTGMVEQSMSGVNEGIAAMAGMPVDLVTGALNLGSRGINAVAGTDIPPIEDPLGGSGSFRDMLAPTISNTPPQTTGQRYGRRIGQEVGATAIPGGLLMRGAKNPLAFAGAETASAVSAGTAGQTAREVAPDSDLADFVASALGGGSAIAATRAMRPAPKAPTLDELAQQRDAGYDAVEESGATLSPQSAGVLADNLQGTLGPRMATRKLNPKATIAADELAGDLRTQPQTLSDVDQIRQWIGGNVAGSAEAGERALGVKMKGAIDSHLDGLQPSDVTGTNSAAEVVETLRNARDKAHRIHKSELFEAEDTGAIEKGLRRAATTGTGGNEVNALRQNVRRVLENPKLRRGYSPDELQAMREIADGTPTQNAMRLVGRMAPTSGAFGIGGLAATAGAAGATMNPLFVAPSAIGQVTKALAERSTKKQVAGLGELIRNGKPLPKKGMGDLERRLMASLIARKTADQTSQGDDVQNAQVRAAIAAAMRFQQNAATASR